MKKVLGNDYIDRTDTKSINQSINQSINTFTFVKLILEEPLNGVQYRLK